jgi:creatinine amidohydrolase
VTRHFADLRAPEIVSRLTSTSIILQPVGAIEQHGPHLPLSVDLVVAAACAEAVAEARGDELDIWLLPPLAVTKSNEHTGFPGSLSLKAMTMLAVLDDIAAGIAATPARKLVFLNGHGGNSALLNVACREIRVDHGLDTFLMHPFVPPDQGGASPESELGMGIHAGHEETSVMLHLAPDLVDMSLATRNVPEALAANRHVKFGGTTSFGWLARDFGPDGHIGDPTVATAAEGERLFNRSVELVGDQLAEVSQFSF